MQTGKNKYAIAVDLMRCFNVAAICSLAIWHGYAFYLEQALRQSPKPPAIEFKLQDQAVANHSTQAPPKP